jgi:2-polyprenyl-3-methyl-5-hydroxy-6-metoxy-1,4-benzoquinol methylase
MTHLKIDYAWLPGNLVQKSMWEECSQLFSTQYGVWSRHEPEGRAGRKVRFGPERIRQLLISPDSRIAYARSQGSLIGYAIAVQTDVERYGVVSWVTQLVVHERYRHSGVGKTLLFSIWGFSNHFAWGLTTANPYAIRALEKATRRRCVPTRIRKNHKKLISIGTAHVPYLPQDNDSRITPSESTINTRFFVDHSGLGTKLERASEKAPWLLGNLEEGWEWFAFTFQDQEQLSISADELRTMLEASDAVTRQAYGRMTEGKGHLWAAHAEDEAQLVIEQCNLQSGQSVLDLGCGRGRHCIALGSLGLRVTGIDYVEHLIDQARMNSGESTAVEFTVGDCREIRLGKTYDAVICLYDVIGSYAEDRENLRIVESMHAHLAPGGYALLSVMNLELTKLRAINRFSLNAEPDKLLALHAANLMETTGDIFDPQYYMIDRDTDVVYRKERFVEGGSLPLELIVRDRRFTKEQIEELCRQAGLEIVWSRFVRAGQWATPLDRTDDRAKEILVLCRRLR